MKPTLEKTSFGSITIDGQEYGHDILIRLDGSIEKRAKKLSKQVYGTSHTLSLAEAQHTYQVGAKRLIIGTGQYGLVTLSPEAQEFFDAQGLAVVCVATPDALEAWNQAEEAVIGLFHVTC
jgi:hypothetical protein